MLYISSQDFFDKVSKISRLPREKEKEYAVLMKSGDEGAKQLIINSYLPFVAAYTKRHFTYSQPLDIIYRFIATLEAAVDSFNFQQDSRSFADYLSTKFRQDLVNHIIYKG